MTIDDEDIRKISAALESSDQFLCALFAGDGLDATAFNEFKENMRKCSPFFAKFPTELRYICMGLLQIPMQMRNSTAIVAPADREQFKEAIIDVEQLFCSLFSAKSDD